MEETTQNYTEFFSELKRKLTDSAKDYRLIAAYSNEDGKHICMEFQVQPADDDDRSIVLLMVNAFKEDIIRISGDDIYSIDSDDWGYTINLKNGYVLNLEIYQRISPASLEDGFEEELDPGDDPMPN